MAKYTDTLENQLGRTIMRFTNLDELHEAMTADEILAEVRNRLNLPETTPPLDLFIAAYDKYTGHGGTSERAVVEFQIFQTSGRVPDFVGSWVIH